MKNIPGKLATYSAALILLGFGIVYLFRDSFMPYHSQAVSMKWEEVAPATRYLLLALMRATSGGFLTVAVAIIFLQYKFQTDKLPWIPGLILVLGTIPMLCLLYAVLTVSMHTPGRPPMVTDLAGEGLLLTGFFFNMRYLRNGT